LEITLFKVLWSINGYKDGGIIYSNKFIRCERVKVKVPVLKIPQLLEANSIQKSKDVQKAKQISHKKIISSNLSSRLAVFFDFGSNFQAVF